MHACIIVRDCAADVCKCGWMCMGILWVWYETPHMISTQAQAMLRTCHEPHVHSPHTCDRKCIKHEQCTKVYAEQLTVVSAEN